MTAAATLDMPDTLPPSRTPPAGPLAGTDRIVLTGFMGSGKSTVGALLAARLGWDFLDLDREIERHSGLTVPALFAQHGEPGFRRRESGALARLLGRPRAVIALGGGAPETLGNRLLLEQTPRTAVVYLAAPLPTLLARCARDAERPEATTRPLLAEAEPRFTVRHPLYLRIAHHTIHTADLTLDATVLAILNAVHQPA